MPLPEPASGETEDDFISRCMENPTMQSEYPDRDQRIAVCYSLFEGEKAMDQKTITGYFGKAPKRVDSDGARIYPIIASTADIDRDKEIIIPAAFKNLSAFLAKNPVILFGHDHWSRPPIGKAIDGRISETALELDIKFAPTEFGREIEMLYKDGFMNGFSVGFVPKESHLDSEGRRVFTEVELLEVSAVPVPANEAAVMLRDAGPGFEGMKAYYAMQKLISAEQSLPDLIIRNCVAINSNEIAVSTDGTNVESSTPVPDGESGESKAKRDAQSLARKYLRRKRYANRN